MKNWSAPAVTLSSGRRSASPTTGRGDPGQEEEKQVDYSHLDIVAEVERITGCSLHHVTKNEYDSRCPFPGCPSMNNAFKVWDRPVLDTRSNGIREKHFWCRRCDHSGSIIDLIIQYREATTGETTTWKEAARELRIDPRTWRAIDENNEPDQGEQRRTSAREKRRLQDEKDRKTAQRELENLDAAYPLARRVLAAGQVVINDLAIPLDLARAYLAARGFTIEQAAALGMGYIPSRQEIDSDQAGEQIAVWRQRILFPLSGPAGVRGYAGRSLWLWKPGMTAEQHKALLEVEGKNRIPRHYKTRQQAFYGYEEACQAHTLVVVEGEFDAASVRLALSDLPDIAVCAFGKNFSPRLVPANVLSIILALDVDVSSEELNRHFEELDARGLEVDIALPPEGKDWNECHQLAGLAAIREEIIRACKIAPACSPAIALAPVVVEQASTITDVDDIGLTENQQDDRAGRCLAHAQKVFDGESNGEPVWPESYTLTLLPAGMNCDEYIERWYQGERPGRVIGPATMETMVTCDQNGQSQADQEGFSATNSRCAKHGRALRYSDEMGGRYCSHVDCWERYRLIRAGAALDYPILSVVIDPRDYLADTSKTPVSWYCSLASHQEITVYPAHPPIRQQLIAAGADTWRKYVARHEYQDIDKAVKALASA